LRRPRRRHAARPAAITIIYQFYYLFLGTVVSAVRPDLLSAGGTVHLLAELGIVFLLFDIGLHFSTAHVRREAGDIFGFGPLQLSASTILIGGCAWALGLSPIAALVVGTTLALSSTAIVAGVIADRRQQNCPVALTAIAILIFQDVAAIFLLILTTTLEARHGVLGRVGITDRGMASAKNLAWLRDTGRRYIIGAPKSEPKNFGVELPAAAGWRTVQA